MLLVWVLLAGMQLGWSAEPAFTSAKTRSLSLEESIRIALRRNLDLQVHYLAADIARYNLEGSFGAYIPVFSTESRHDFVSMPGSFDPQKFNPDFPYKLNTDTFQSSLTGKTPVGLEYDFSAKAGEERAITDFRWDAESSKAFTGGIRRTNDYFANARVTLRQHLLKDFWINPERQTILLRRKDLKISEQALRFQIMKTVLAVEVAYYELAAARERIGVQEKALQLRQQLVSETKRRVEVGDLPPLDAEQTQTQLQNTMTSLSAARENWNTQQNLLKRLLSDTFTEWAYTDLETADTLAPLARDVNRPLSYRTALEQRPDLIEARVAVEKNDVIVRFQKNQLLPSLDLVGRYGGLAISTQPGSALDDAFSFRNPEFFYGVVLTMPLSNLKERRDYRASQTAKRITELQLKKAEQEVLWSVADLVNRAQSRLEQVNSTRRARSYAEAALGAEEKKLQNGLSTSFFVLQLQETLTAARMAEVQAIVDYNKTLAELAFADGTTLEKHHLGVEVAGP